MQGEPMSPSHAKASSLRSSSSSSTDSDAHSVSTARLSGSIALHEVSHVGIDHVPEQSRLAFGLEDLEEPNPSTETDRWDLDQPLPSTDDVVLLQQYLDTLDVITMGPDQSLREENLLLLGNEVPANSDLLVRRCSELANMKKNSSRDARKLNHIRCERERRQSMNRSLATLLAMVPSRLLRNNDQISIVSGTIKLIEELEQILEELQARKRIRDQFGVSGSFGFHAVNQGMQMYNPDLRR